MKRYTGVRVLCQAMLDSDVGIFIGEGICREASSYVDKDKVLFFSDYDDYAISLSLGVALGTDKRIFVFCEDNYFARNLSELMQAGISKCRNIFFILFVGGLYNEVSATPVVFDSVNSQHGILYNIGFLVHDYSKFFKNSKNPIKEIRDVWSRTKGPLAVLLKTERSNKQFEDVLMTDADSIKKVQDFISNKNIKGYRFDAPITAEDLSLEV